MMTEPNRYKGFASLDALISVLPILMILFVLWQASLSIANNAKRTMKNQDLFNRLVSVADYTVKSGAVVRKEGLRYPNWVDENLLTQAYVDKLRNKAGLEDLAITTGTPGEGICIYRLVVCGEQKEIKKLFVCGD